MPYERGDFCLLEFYLNLSNEYYIIDEFCLGQIDLSKLEQNKLIIRYAPFVSIDLSFLNPKYET